MTTPPITDPFAGLDPRIKAALQAVQQAKGVAQPPDPTPQANVPPAIAETPGASAIPPPPPAPIPTGMQMQPQQNVTPPPTPSTTPQVTQTPTGPGPIKSFLSNFLYGGGQAMLKHVGLQTDAEKAEEAQNNQFRQSQIQNMQDFHNQQQRMAQQQFGLKSDAQDFTQAKNPVDAGLLKFLGLPDGTQLSSAELAQQFKQYSVNKGKTDVQDLKNDGTQATNNMKYGDSSFLNHGFKDVGGRAVMYDKRTGETLKDMGPSNSLVVGANTAEARARASAKYGLVNTMDADGNPVGVSRMTALQQGAPTVSFDATKGVKSDLVGIGQYKDILDNKISPNLSVLNDNTQRAIIAHTLSEADKNPGMLQSIITSGMQSGLTPQGAALAAGIMQGREFGGVARKYGGNMNGTEGLMNRIMANQASPLNSEALNRELIQNDRDFTDKAGKAIGGLTSHRSNVPTPVSATPAPAAKGGGPVSTPATGGSWAAQFGGVPVKP